eukprot:CAMPEP_0201993598 /NCGR_PEP_ID=MMETSP0905-20130828/1762_1 /ASSEMBLY_ACC=CAM_ASM_000554 /TAXON_ID=420261 /ORGANISM="Thalassiosira antarctica, Strain CCMP982" /LENGTH=734 /DNA_ID=CAMNT_0048548461 /DNA_START=64 /DNA_END=2264 /DNA_ORIENTATION=-
MLEVAVIGAGTSGLVAARHLIHAGLRPTIFEAARTVGGAWTPSSSSNVNGHSTGNHPASKMWNGMSTNLSKYTCRFSDWPWPEDASTFPSVEEMHDYLQSYSDAFLTTSSCNFQLECKVFNVEQLESSSSQIVGQQQDANTNYKVEWTDLNTQTTHSRDFGGVVVATGFFHTPRWPSFLKNRRDCEDDENKKKPQLMHSSEYRNHRLFRGKNVAVIGSSFSALEIAADISRSAARVVNVSPSIPWVLPRWIPTVQPLQSASTDSATVTILPADLSLYQRKQPYPNIPETTSLTPESCRKRHQYLQSLVGHKQRQSPLGEPTNWEEPPFVAISDEYLDLVREGKVEVVHGRLVGVDEDGTLQISDIETTGSDKPQSHCSVLSDIDTVLLGTGYTSQLHDVLSPDILSKLAYDPDDSFSPMTLAWDTLHPSLPNLAFCGMYRGPYMGIMELQARLAAGVMSGSLSLEEEQLQSAMTTSQTIRSSTPRAQFPHFDYPGFMDTLSQLCYLRGDCPKYNRDVGDVVVPTLYQPDEELSQKCQSEIQQEIKHGQDGRRMPKVVLQSILGKWSFDRHIVHLQTGKVERVYGTVNYSKYWERSSTDDDDDDGNADGIFSLDTKDNPVLYREDGLYELSPTQKFEVFREYEYECKNDSLEIYFVEGGKRTYLFLSLKFVPEATSSVHQSLNGDDGYWVKATSDHLCIKDLYSATFRVKLNGLSASEVIIKYRVKGPSKDYEST